VAVAVALSLALVQPVRAHVALSASLDTAQEVPAPKLRFAVNLDSAQEVPAPTVGDPPPTGSGTFTLDPANNTIAYQLTVQNLTGAPIAAHIHEGAPGVAGDIVQQIDHVTLEGTTDALEPANVAALFAGNLYVNVHTSANMAGEVRGQLAPLPTGTAEFSLEEDNTLQYTITVQNLSGPATAAHLHRGEPGTPGPVEITLDHTTLTGTTSALTAEQLADLFDGLLYVNVHTELNTGGEIRGQVGRQVTDETCSCRDATRPKDFKRCVKREIAGLSREIRRSPDMKFLKKIFKRASCGKTRGPRRTIACCLPHVGTESIVVGRLCAPIKERACSKFGGTSLGAGSSCFPDNPCPAPASPSGAFVDGVLPRGL
jgi:hypothetical protein